MRERERERGKQKNQERGMLLLDYKPVQLAGADCAACKSRLYTTASHMNRPSSASVNAESSTAPA